MIYWHSCGDRMSLAAIAKALAERAGATKSRVIE
jgi:hypothetical protein